MAKVLADPKRVEILTLVAAAPKAGITVNDLAAAVGLSQPTTSHHLRKLRAAGLVGTDVVGVHSFQSIAPRSTRLFADAIRGLS